MHKLALSIVLLAALFMGAGAAAAAERPAGIDSSPSGSHMTSLGLTLPALPVQQTPDKGYYVLDLDAYGGAVFVGQKSDIGPGVIPFCGACNTTPAILATLAGPFGSYDAAAYAYCQSAHNPHGGGNGVSRIDALGKTNLDADAAPDCSQYTSAPPNPPITQGPASGGGNGGGNNNGGLSATMSCGSSVSVDLPAAVPLGRPSNSGQPSPCDVLITGYQSPSSDQVCVDVVEADSTGLAAGPGGDDLAITPIPDCNDPSNILSDPYDVGLFFHGCPVSGICVFPPQPGNAAVPAGCALPGPHMITIRVTQGGNVFLLPSTVVGVGAGAYTPLGSTGGTGGTGGNGGNGNGGNGNGGNGGSGSGNSGNSGNNGAGPSSVTNVATCTTFVSGLGSSAASLCQSIQSLASSSGGTFNGVFQCVLGQIQNGNTDPNSVASKCAGAGGSVRSGSGGSGGNGGSGSGGTGGSGSGGSGNGGSSGNGGNGGSGASTGSQGGCTQWNISGTWQLTQSGGYNPTLTLQQTGTSITGTFSLSTADQARGNYSAGSTSLTGTLTGNQLKITTNPLAKKDGSASQGLYTGTVVQGQIINGTASDLLHPGSTATWTATGPTACAGSSGASGSSVGSSSSNDQLQKLGPIDWNGYCKSLGGSGASLDGGTINDWHCVDASGKKTGINTGAACQWEYGSNVAKWDNFNDPNSWACFG